MIYIKLYLEFFKIGLFAVGGGFATFPFLHQLAERVNWITTEELLDMIAISESTPGPIGINTATFVGNTAAGTLGGIIATLGVVTPSIIVVILVMYYFTKFSDTPIVKSAFSTIRPAVAGLVGAAGLGVAKVALLNTDKYSITGNAIDIFNISSILLFCIMIYLINKYKKHPIVYIIGAAVIGIVFKF